MSVDTALMLGSCVAVVGMTFGIMLGFPLFDWWQDRQDKRGRR